MAEHGPEYECQYCLCEITNKAGDEVHSCVECGIDACLACYQKNFMLDDTICTQCWENQ